MPSIFESESAYTMRSRGFKSVSAAPAPRRFADMRGDSSVAIARSSYEEDGRHPTYEVRVKMQNATESFCVRKRFREFRELYERIGALSNIRRIYKNKFPPTYFKSSFGFALTEEELDARTRMLQLWVSEVTFRIYNEGWDPRIVVALNDFMSSGEEAAEEEEEEEGKVRGTWRMSQWTGFCLAPG